MDYSVAVVLPFNGFLVPWGSIRLARFGFGPDFQGNLWYADKAKEPAGRDGTYSHVAGQSDAWYGNKSQSTLWEENKPAANRLHPTMKPVELVECALMNSSKSGDIVVGLFGGSGTKLIACQRRGRTARLMKLDPRYADVIVNRWQDYTGKKATLESDGRSFEENPPGKERGRVNNVRLLEVARVARVAPQLAHLRGGRCLRGTGHFWPRKQKARHGSAGRADRERPDATLELSSRCARLARA